MERDHAVNMRSLIYKAQLFGRDPHRYDTKYMDSEPRGLLG
jgi:hypothetical protein